MIFIFNDSRIEISNDAIAASSGGTSAHLAAFITFLIRKKIPFRLCGNFKQTGNSIPVTSIITNSNFLFLLRLFKKLLRLKLKRSDVLYFQRPDHAALASLVKGTVVVHLHGQPRETILHSRNTLTKATYCILELIAFRIADRIVMTDRNTFTYYRDLFPEMSDKFVILPTAIDLAFYQPVSGQDGYPTLKKGRQIIFAGRFAYPKRIDQIVKAFGKISAWDDQIRLVLAGEGPLKPEIERLAGVMNLSGKITFTGNLTKAELLNWIQSSDIAILLSFNEGSPVSVKEFLACGVPVVANAVGDLAEYIVDGKTGKIVNADDLTSVAEGIKEVITAAPSMKSQCREMMKPFDTSCINPSLLSYLAKPELEKK